jgi:hypothetical protein
MVLRRGNGRKGPNRRQSAARQNRGGSAAGKQLCLSGAAGLVMVADPYFSWAVYLPLRSYLILSDFFRA